MTDTSDLTVNQIKAVLLETLHGEVATAQEELRAGSHRMAIASTLTACRLISRIENLKLNSGCDTGKNIILRLTYADEEISTSTLEDIHRDIRGWLRDTGYDRD